MTPVTNPSCTLFEKWTGVKPDLSKLRVLGCKAFYQIEKSARGGEFMLVSYKGMLINYSSSSPPYCVWDYARQKVYRSLHLRSMRTLILAGSARPSMQLLQALPTTKSPFHPLPPLPLSQIKLN